MDPSYINTCFSRAGACGCRLSPTVASVALAINHSGSSTTIAMPIGMLSGSSGVFMVPRSISFTTNRSRAALRMAFPGTRVKARCDFRVAFSSRCVGPCGKTDLSEAIVRHVG